MIIVINILLLNILLLLLLFIYSFMDTYTTDRIFSGSNITTTCVIF